MTVLPEMAGTRSPGTRIPTRFSGSAADNTTVSPGERHFAGGSQRFHRHRQSELFAEKSIHKTSAANLAAIFQPAESHLQFAPFGQIRSRGPADRERRCRSVSAASSRSLPRRDFGRLPGRCTEAPSGPCCAADAPSRPLALPGAALGINQRAQIVEAIGGDQPAGNQFPQGQFRLRLSAPGAAHDVGEE